jgi:hypothetical protein
MGTISGRKCIIRIFSKYRGTGRKSNEMIIAQEERREGTNPFQVFHTSSSSTYRQKMESKQLDQPNMFPRKYISLRSFFALFLTETERP